MRGKVSSAWNGIKLEENRHKKMFPVNHKNDGRSFLDYNTNGFLNVYLLEITIKKKSRSIASMQHFNRVSGQACISPHLQLGKKGKRKHSNRARKKGYNKSGIT
jgi:hypothetical protein